MPSLGINNGSWRAELSSLILHFQHLGLHSVSCSSSHDAPIYRLHRAERPLSLGAGLTNAV
jgi:hypothetical protein